MSDKFENVAKSIVIAFCFMLALISMVGMTIALREIQDLSVEVSDMAAQLDSIEVVLMELEDRVCVLEGEAHG